MGTRSACALCAHDVSSLYETYSRSAQVQPVSACAALHSRLECTSQTGRLAPVMPVFVFNGVHDAHHDESAYQKLTRASSTGTLAESRLFGNLPSPERRMRNNPFKRLGKSPTILDPEKRIFMHSCKLHLHAARPQADHSFSFIFALFVSGGCLRRRRSATVPRI